MKKSVLIGLTFVPMIAGEIINLSLTLPEIGLTEKKRQRRIRPGPPESNREFL